MRPYSPHRIDAYESCKLYFKALYQDGMRDNVKSDAMLGGALFHRLAQKYYQHLIDTEQPTDISEINHIIQSNIRSEPMSVIDEYTQIFRTWAESQVINDGTWKNIGVEKRLALDADYTPVPIDNDDDWDSDKIFIRGIIDRLEVYGNDVIIRDYKTNYVVPSESELRNSLQAQIYPLLVVKAMDIIPNSITFVFEYVRFNISRSIDINPDMNNTETWLHNKAEEIENTVEYPATFCSMCEFCPVRGECPAMLKALNNNIQPPTNADEAVKLGETLLALERKVNDVKELMKLYISNHGSVRVGDQEYRQNISESYEFEDTEKFVNYMIDKGLDKSTIWQMLKVGKTNFEKAMKKAKMEEIIPNVVDEVGTPKITSRTQFYKVREK